MITELTETSCIHICDGCGIRVEVTEANLAEFQLTWYESITRDFCPLCQTGEAIERDRSIRAKLLEKYQKGLIKIRL
jgi:hypothetical protein